MNGQSEEDMELSIELSVRKSALSPVGTGIGRINSSYLEDMDDEAIKMISVSCGKRKIAVKLVTDRLAEKGFIILREGDMKALGAKEGDLVVVSPYKALTEDMKESWKKFLLRFKREGDEDEEGG